jgi:hypothetical protein
VARKLYILKKAPKFSFSKEQKQITFNNKKVLHAFNR